MKHSTTTSYRISNNLSGGRRKRGAVGRAPPGVKPTKSVIETAKESDGKEGKVKSTPAGGTPVREPKRRDQKSTPKAHVAIRAEETAPRKDKATETKTDPITELVTGSGGTKPAGAPLDREELSSSRKVLFGGTSARVDGG